MVHPRETVSGDLPLFGAKVRSRHLKCMDRARVIRALVGAMRDRARMCSRGKFVDRLSITAGILGSKQVLAKVVAEQFYFLFSTGENLRLPSSKHETSNNTGQLVWKKKDLVTSPAKITLSSVVGHTFSSPGSLGASSFIATRVNGG